MRTLLTYVIAIGAAAIIASQAADFFGGLQDKVEKHNQQIEQVLE